ncbi:MAG: HlyC/CorC family transporter [Candidatus Hydrogenedentes bacterium]|nr:HlyC/CorC family transporter [Candidatus Hydrogenedentota bacterium]
MIVLIVAMSAALVISALCSLLEATLLSLTPTQVARFGESHPTVMHTWQKLKSEIKRPIAVILVLNTFSHTIGAAVAGAQFESLYGKEWLATFSIVFSILILQFTEILPKTLGVRYNALLAPIVGIPLYAVVRASAPFIAVINLINRPFEGRQRKDHSGGTVDEIAALAGMARLSNLIGEYEESIIKNATKMSLTKVDSVMIPHDQITFLSTAQTMTDAVLTAHWDPHTRFPICDEGDHDRVLGYINFKELVYRARTNPSDPSLRGIIRPVHFVHQDESAAELLRMFVEQHVHMAIVRDDNDKTLGLVTMEDLVEELVGELEDEFDRLPRMCHALSGGTWMVGGGFPASKLDDVLGVTLENARGSTSAWLIDRMKRLPRVNEVHQEAGYEFLIRRTRRGKIFEVSVSKPRPVAARP